MNSDSLGALTCSSLSISQDPQMAAPTGLDGATLVGLVWRARGDGTGHLSGPTGFTHGIGKRQQVVLGGTGVRELRCEADGVPAPRHGQTLGVHGAQVVGVRLCVGCQRPQDSGLVRVDIGQCRNGATGTGGAGTLTRQTHGWTVFLINDTPRTPRRRVDS